MNLPRLLIVGPQKTGTTALASFLALSPHFRQNRPVPRSFEEPQFFGGANYERGLRWYTNLFDNITVDNEV